MLSPMLVRTFVDLLYPPACLLCRTRNTGSPPPLLCGACAEALRRNGPPVCQHCGLEVPGAFDSLPTCPACRRRPPAFDLARAPWRYAGPIRMAVRQFKYRRRWRVGRWLAGQMAQTAAAALPLDAVDLVAPVPMHRLRRLWRGFDHAAFLSKSVARALDKPHQPAVLRRSRWTGPQPRRARPARRRNVRGAFAADPRRLRGRTVLLVDDVLTTGATADACARTLKQAGAARVFVLTAARTPLE